MNAPQKVGIGASLSPRGRRGQGHRRGEIRRRVSRPRHALSASRSCRRSPGAGLSRSTRPRARAVPGVVDIVSHLNRPRHAWRNKSWKDELKIPR